MLLLVSLEFVIGQFEFLCQFCTFFFPLEKVFIVICFLLSDDVTSLQNQLDTLLPEYLELQKQHQILKDDFANLEKTYKASLQDLDDCESRCKIVEGHVNSLEETNRQLKHLLTQQEADYNKDLLERKEKCTKLTQELELSNNKLQAHKQKHRENSRALSTQTTQTQRKRKLPSMYHQFKKLGNLDITTTPMQTPSYFTCCKQTLHC
jgi:chromosome segregation ATPase